MSVLSVRGVDKAFRRRRVLSGVSFDLRQGEALAIVGENGAGKTTLLRICAGMLAADRGQVVRDRRLAYCPQEPGLVEHLTATEHVRYIGAGMGWRGGEAEARGRPLLRWLRFPDDQPGTVRELSGGTRQKLNLVLSLLADAPLLLLDEPYQGFDRGTYENFWAHIDKWRDEGKAVVVVTHLLAELNRVDRVLELRRGGEWSLTPAMERELS